MWLYIKYCDGDGSFDTVESLIVPKFNEFTCENKLKKFQVLGNTKREAQIIFCAESKEELELKKEKERIRYRPVNILESASEIESTPAEKIEKEEEELKRKRETANLLEEKLKNISAVKSINNDKNEKLIQKTDLNEVEIHGEIVSDKQSMSNEIERICNEKEGGSDSSGDRRLKVNNSKILANIKKEKVEDIQLSDGNIADKNGKKKKRKKKESSTEKKATGNKENSSVKHEHSSEKSKPPKKKPKILSTQILTTNINVPLLKATNHIHKIINEDFNDQSIMATISAGTEENNDSNSFDTVSVVQKSMDTDDQKELSLQDTSAEICTSVSDACRMLLQVQQSTDIDEKELSLQDTSAEIYTSVSDACRMQTQDISECNSPSSVEKVNNNENNNKVSYKSDTIKKDSKKKDDRSKEKEDNKKKDVKSKEKEDSKKKDDRSKVKDDSKKKDDRSKEKENSKKKDERSKKKDSKKEDERSKETKDKNKKKKNKHKKSEIFKEKENCSECIKLKNILQEKEEEIEQLKQQKKVLEQRNGGLQDKILLKIDEYAARDINPFTLDNKGDIPLGFEDKATNQIYCGSKIYISKNAFYKAVNSSMTPAKLKSKDKGYSMFVKDVAESIIGRDILKERSVKGRKCNAIPGSVAKQKIDENQLLAITGIFKYYLIEHRKLDPISAEMELGNVNAYIASKISDLNKKVNAKGTSKNKRQKRNNSENSTSDKIDKPSSSTDSSSDESETDMKNDEGRSSNKDSTSESCSDKESISSSSDTE